MKHELKQLQIEKASIADDEHNEIIKTMTPQEKADELVKKMYKVMSDSVSDVTLYFSKQCALIAVDEIIKMSDINKIFYSFYEGDCLNQYTEDFYWKKVKQEIEKL